MRVIINKASKYDVYNKLSVCLQKDKLIGRSIVFDYISESAFSLFIYFTVKIVPKVQ